MRRQPPHRHPVGGLADQGGGRPRLHLVRRRRSHAGPGMAGSGLSADRLRVRRLGAAHPGPPGGQPGPLLPVAQRPQGGHRPLRQAPGDGAHDQRGGGRVQPPVAGGHPVVGGPTCRRRSQPGRVVDRHRWSTGIGRSTGNRWSTGNGGHQVDAGPPGTAGQPGTAGPRPQDGSSSVQSTRIGRGRTNRGRPTRTGRSVVHSAAGAKVRPASPRSAWS